MFNKKQLEVFKRRNAKVKTTDDWYPNFPNSEVEISLMKLMDGKSTYRLCVWGADDCGMEIDVETTNPDNLIREYESLISSPPITKKHLTSLGFVRA